MSREIKEKPRGAKGTGRKLHVVPKEFMRRRLLNGKERAKERIRDTEPAQDNTEDYGSEQIEGGVQGGTVLAGRGVEAIGWAARRGKAKDGKPPAGAPRRREREKRVLGAMRQIGRRNSAKERLSATRRRPFGRRGRRREWPAKPRGQPSGTPRQRHGQSRTQYGWL